MSKYTDESQRGFAHMHTLRHELDILMASAIEGGHNRETEINLLKTYGKVVDELIFTARDVAYLDALELSELTFTEDYPERDKDGNVLINPEVFMELMEDSFTDIQKISSE
jgi:hypothetical protein